MSIEERFLKYISFDTQSDPQSSTTPSSIPCKTTTSFSSASS